jgi:hypothetical protein
VSFCTFVLVSKSFCTSKASKAPCKSCGAHKEPKRYPDDDYAQVHGGIHEHQRQKHVEPKSDRLAERAQLDGYSSSAVSTCTSVLVKQAN